MCVAGVGTTADQSIQIEKDADFICTRITAVCRTATQGRVVGADSNDGTEDSLFGSLWVDSTAAVDAYYNVLIV